MAEPGTEIVLTPVENTISEHISTLPVVVDGNVPDVADDTPELADVRGPLAVGKSPMKYAKDELILLEIMY